MMNSAAITPLPCRFLLKHLVLLMLWTSIGGAGAYAADENAEPALPAPRDAKGKVIISRAPGEKAGIWVPN